jgi:hypothetical protein
MLLRVMDSVFVRLYEFSPHKYFAPFRKFAAVIKRFNDDKTPYVFSIIFNIVVSMNAVVFAHTEHLVLQKVVCNPRIQTAFTIDLPSNRFCFKPLLRFRCLPSRP